MRRLNLSTALAVAGDATTATISYSGLTSPTVTEIGDNPDVSVSSGGVCTFTALGSGSEVVTVKVQDAAGYFIQGPVTIQGLDIASYISMGMNIGSPTSYSTRAFSNMLHCAATNWQRSSGSGSWSWDRGEVTASVSTDRFVLKLFDGNGNLGWPSGSFTIRNPDGCKICVGTPGVGTFRTDLEYTQNISPGGGNGVYLYVEGSLTNINGPLEIIRTDHVAEYDAGNIFASEFLDWMTALAPSTLRFMDWTNASGNIETDWTDRSLPTDITFRRSNASTLSVPYEVCFDLAERIGANPWICIPPRATDDYVTQYATLAASLLPTGKKLYTELGNEIWNPGSSWNRNRNWVRFLTFTKSPATANPGAGTFTLAGHGWSDGQALIGHMTRENYAAGVTPPTALAAGDITSYVEVVDADTFKLKTAVPPSGTYVSPVTGQVNNIFNKATESGKTDDNNGNYGRRSLAMWDILDAELGAANVYHIVGTQAANSGITSGRMVTGMSARADGVAVAPYFAGTFWAGQVQITSGTLTPSVWSNAAGYVFTAAVYAAGSTPSIYEVMTGTGTGYIGHTVGTPYTTAAFWRGVSAGLSAISGLSDGTTYKVFFVRSASGVNLMNSVDAVCSATPSSVFTWDTDINQMVRMMNDIKYSRSTYTSHSAASQGVPIICYETGQGLDSDTIITDVAALARTWQKTPESGKAVKTCLSILASSGIGESCYFSAAGPGTFSLGDEYSSTTDERYLAYTSLGGRVRVNDSYLAISDITPADISSDPGSFPQTIATFADASLTYVIYSGNDYGNYDISGNTLRMINDNGVDWANGRTDTLIIYAYNDRDIDSFTVNQTLGPWYLPTSFIDIDYVSDRARINGVDYASIADARTAGAIVAVSGYDTVDVTGLLGTDYTVVAKGVTAPTAPGYDYHYLVHLDDASGTGNNSTGIVHTNTSGSTRGFYAFNAVGGVGQLNALGVAGNFSTTSDAGTNTPFAAAFRIKDNDFAISYNSATIITDTAGSVGSRTRLIIGNRYGFTTTNAWQGPISRVAILADAVVDAKLPGLCGFNYTP